jgi:hypothetical protein
MIMRAMRWRSEAMEEGLWRAVRVGLDGLLRGEKASLEHEEAVSRQAQGDMVVEAAPAATLELGQADFLLR